MKKKVIPMETEEQKKAKAAQLHQQFMNECARLGELIYAYESLPKEIEDAKLKVKLTVDKIKLSAKGA